MIRDPDPGFRRKMVVVGVVSTLAVAYLLRGVLVPLFLAFLVAYALDPLVDRLEALRVPRSLGALVVMAGLLGGFVVVAFYAVPVAIDEVRDAAAELPAQLESLRQRLEPFVTGTLKLKMPASLGELGSALQGNKDAVVGTVSVALFGTLSYVGVALSALIVPVFALYLLIDFDRIVRRVGELVPRRFFPPVAEISRQVHKTLSSYVRGQLTANLVLAALYATGLRLVDIRLAVPIGVVTGLLAFVPYVGFSIGMTAALAMAVLDWQGVGPVLGVVGVMAGVQALDAMVITPRIVGRSVGLEPLEVIVTMMAAGSLLGFLGVLLAVPLGAVVKILVRRIVAAYLASPFYKAPPSPAP